MIPSLEALLAPNDPGTLRAAVRERRRLHLRTGDSDRFGAILPWSTFNGLLKSGRLLDDRSRVVRRGRDLPREMWSVVGTDLKRVVLADQLQRLCEEGLSIMLAQAHLDIPALAALATMLEQALSTRVHTNVYASFGKESAFRTHHDPHDVLVLHLHGRKRWSCFGQRPEAYADTPLVPEQHIPPLQWEVVLEPGDILFLPRGEVHCAAIEGKPSLHLTHSLNWPRGSDLLKWVAGNAMADLAFDRDIPIYGSTADVDAYTHALRAQLHRLADTVDVPAFLASYVQQRRVQLPFNLGLSTALAPDCWVQPLPAPDVPLPDEGGATIPFNGGTVTLDPHERAVLAALLTHGSKQIEALPALTGLEAHAARDAVARLARRSLVALTEGDPA